MAETYKSQGTNLTATSSIEIYSGVVGTAIVNNINISNTDTTNGCDVNIYLKKGATSYSIISNVEIPIGTTLQVLNSPLICESGNTITATATAANRITTIVSVLEIT
jgi:hypothetical protein